MGALPADAAQRPRSAANGNLNGGGGSSLHKRTALPSPLPRRVTAGPLPSGGGSAFPVSLWFFFPREASHVARMWRRLKIHSTHRGRSPLLWILIQSRHSFSSVVPAKLSLRTARFARSSARSSRWTLTDDLVLLQAGLRDRRRSSSRRGRTRACLRQGRARRRRRDGSGRRRHGEPRLARRRRRRGRRRRRSSDSG